MYCHTRRQSVLHGLSLGTVPYTETLGIPTLPNFLGETLQILLHHIIIWFLINMQVQGQHPHQWAPFQIAGLLHAGQISHQISISIMRVDSRELLLSAVPLCQLLPMSSLASQAHAFPHLVCERLSWLHHWSIPHVHTSRAFSTSEWGPDPQCQATQVVYWTWWWQHLAAWLCRSFWSLPCHSAADIGGLVLSVAKSRWHGALLSAHKSCTHGHLSWKRGGVKRERVAAPWTSSRRFLHVLWLKVHSRLLLRACLLGSKRKLPPPACQVQLGLPSVVCHPRGMQFPGTVYICSQGPLSSTWAHYICLQHYYFTRIKYLCQIFGQLGLSQQCGPRSNC